MTKLKKRLASFYDGEHDNPLTKEQRLHIKNLHPDFRISSYDGFYYNHVHWVEENSSKEMKVRFWFDDPKQLDDMPFAASISINLYQEEALKGYKYYGFFYDNKRRLMVEVGKRFPHATFTLFLDHDGDTTSKTNEMDIEFA